MPRRLEDPQARQALRNDGGPASRLALVPSVAPWLRRPPSPDPGRASRPTSDVPVTFVRLTTTDDDKHMSNDRPSDDTRKRKGLDGRMIGGRYRVTRTVAAGANTLIADAHDTQLDRQVTIKLVRPELSESDEFRRTFRKYMEVMAGISHPNIAAVYDWGEERIGKRTTVFAVVEYLSGGSLRDLFDRGRNLTPSQALMVGLEACRGLDFAHRQGFVHTELTPSKLVFGDDRRLRIVDFGLARALGEQDWLDRSRLATHVARYASPEQALGEPLDSKTDVYSLALILVEAVTGSAPFMGDSTVSTLSARIGKLMPVSADLGPLASVLERAGRPEAGERASASQFGRALVRTAERMPRPTPIPILASGLFVDDPSTMRRPDDPTGGVVRPPAASEPALVPPSVGGPVSPTDTTSEIAGADSTARMTRSELDLAIEPPADADAPLMTSTSSTSAGPSTDATAATSATNAADAAAVPTVPPASSLGAPASGDDASPTIPSDDDVHGELAALVGRTPQKPARAGDKAPGLAERGATAVPPAASRRGRRKQRKAAKAEAKSAAKAAKRSVGRRGEPVRADTPTFGSDERDAPRERRRRRWVPWLVGVFVVGALGGVGYLAWVLLQTPKHEIPAVVGLPQDEALDLVDDFKWEIGLEEGRSDEHSTPGEVISVSPAPGEDLAEGSPLLLEISVGPEYRQVPSLSGKPLADALAEIERLQLTAGEPTEDFSESVPAGTVISGIVDGAPVGGDVLPGAQVNLVVSAGPQQRRVPQLRGLTVEQATQLLDDLGLQIVVVDEPIFDDEVPASEIAVQTPVLDTSVDRDSSITVTVSKGPDLVTVPDLTGRTLPEIGQLLNDSGLQLGAVLGSTQGTFHAASVDGEEIEPGTQVRRGSSVNVIVLVQ